MPTDTFSQLPLFRGLSVAQLDLLRPLFIPHDCHAGTVVFEQGDLAEYLYLLLSGEAVIQFKPEDDEPIVIARIHAGGIVGWSAAIGRRKYTSAAVCTQHTRMLRMRSDDLQRLREQCPEIGTLMLERLASLVAQRSQSTHSHVMAILNNSMWNGDDGQEAKDGD